MKNFSMSQNLPD